MLSPFPFCLWHQERLSDERQLNVDTFLFFSPFISIYSFARVHPASSLFIFFSHASGMTSRDGVDAYSQFFACIIRRRNLYISIAFFFSTYSSVGWRAALTHMSQFGAVEDLLNLASPCLFICRTVPFAFVFRKLV